MSDSDLRKWGLALGVALASVGALAFGDVPVLAGVLWVAAVGVVAAAALRPALVAPVQKGMHVITAPIRWLVTTVISTVVFFGMVVPMGWLLRATGRIGSRPSKDSYWVDRDPKRDESARAFRQS